MQALGRLLNEDGTPNEDVIRKYGGSSFGSRWLLDVPVDQRYMNLS
jgi:hypothetical protein